MPRATSTGYARMGYAHAILHGTGLSVCNVRMGIMAGIARIYACMVAQSMINARVFLGGLGTTAMASALSAARMETAPMGSKALGSACARSIFTLTIARCSAVLHHARTSCTRSARC